VMQVCKPVVFYFVPRRFLSHVPRGRIQTVHGIFMNRNSQGSDRTAARYQHIYQDSTLSQQLTQSHVGRDPLHLLHDNTAPLITSHSRHQTCNVDESMDYYCKLFRGHLRGTKHSRKLPLSFPSLVEELSCRMYRQHYSIGTVFSANSNLSGSSQGAKHHSRLRTTDLHSSRTHLSFVENLHTFFRPSCGEAIVVHSVVWGPRFHHR
jgi:hypothetical protein